MVPFVRAARPVDSAEIVDIHRDAWLHRYPEWPTAVWQELDASGTVDAWRADITSPPSPKHHVLVATADDGAVCGFAVLEPSTDPDLESHTCVTMFEVTPACRGQGHGSRLMSAAVEHALRDDAIGLTLWVDQGSPATRFLTDAGWGPRGVRRTLEIADGILLQQHHWWTLIEDDTDSAPAATVTA